MQLGFLGAIFDADGTLLDSMHVWRNLGELYLLRRGITPEEGLSSRLWPLSYAQGCEYIRSHYGLHETVSEIQADISLMIEGFYRNEAKLKPGVHEFLCELKLRDIHMVIATSGDRELLSAALYRNNVAQYFEGIFTCSELGTDKHDSKIYLVCAESLGLAPERVAVFEDVLYAIETAKSAGFITFGVEDESSINDRHRIIDTADYYINDWRRIKRENSINDSRQ